MRKKRVCEVGAKVLCLVLVTVLTLELLPERMMQVVLAEAFQPKTKVEFMKVVNGQALEDLEGEVPFDLTFQFQVKTEEGEVIETVENDEQGEIIFKFDPNEYGLEEGESVYVSEVQGAIPGMDYDETLYEVELKEDDHTGRLRAAANEIRTINNTYSASGEVSLEASVTLEGKDLAADMFEFELKDAEENVIETVANAVEGKVSFGKITYKLEDVGIHTYTISQVQGEQAGITYDDNVCTVTVTVTDNGDGTLTATPSYQDKEFENTYKPSAAEVTLGVSVELEGKALEADMFTFGLKDASGELISTASNDAQGKVTFDKLTYEKVGTYTYTIEQIIRNRAVHSGEQGVTYDSHQCTVTVNVTKVELKVDYEGNVFTNVFKENVSPKDDGDTSKGDGDIPNKVIITPEGDGTDKANKTAVVATGDTANLSLWIGSMLVAVIAMLVVIVICKKKKR